MGKTIAGTRHYAAPEQMGDLQAPVGSHSDVYGFGRSCYYALLGDPEPDDDDKESLPESWRSFLSGCTRKKTDKRVQDFAAVLAALAQLPKHACAVSGWLSWPEKGHERSERTSGTMTETRLSLQWQEVWPDGTWDGCLEGHSEDGVTFKGEYSYPPRDTKPRAFEFQKRVSGTEITLTGSWRKNAHESGEWHAKLKPTAEPPGKTGEEDWRTNHPVAFECARCYRELLANKYHRDVRVKFAKTVIPIYLRGRVRVAVWPRKNDQALITVERLSDAAVGEAVAYLTRHGIAVTPVKRPNNNMLRFDVSVQRLNEQRAAHEWIAEELLAVPPTGAGAGEDDELNDNGDGKAVSERVEILGHSATAVVRWMGKHGWDFNRAQAALHRLGSNIADSTIRIQLLAGARGERGAPAELTADQIAQLEA